jgi:hypothetical protein
MNNNFFLILPGALISGFSVYFTLSYVLIPNIISLPLSIIITVLIFGLAKYYYDYKEENTQERNNVRKIKKISSEGMRNIVFIAIYVILLAVLVNSSFNGDSGLFINWEKIRPIQALDLAAAIAFSFFLPGYALVTVLNKNCKLTRLPKLLLAYLFSMLVTGLAGYIGALEGYATSNTTIFLIGSYVLIFLFYLIGLNALSRGFYHVPPHLFQALSSKIRESIINNHSQFIVFLSLFAFVIFYSYYLNDGKIVVDQWYHHGRALLIVSGIFKDLGHFDIFVPPFFSALLASFFNISGSPSVNAYAAIGFLNIVPVFAFYYFFTKWVPRAKQRAALLASTLFMLSSGFGWLYVLNTSMDSHQQGTFDVSSSLNILNLATEKTYDIGKPTTFIDVGHPDITTPLIIIALPAGFTLLGLLREVKINDITIADDGNNRLQTKSRNSRTLTFITIVTALSFLGILSHDEFYLFIIVASIAMVVFFRMLPVNVNYSVFYVAFLLAITLVILADVFISPARFYTYRALLGIPIITVCFLIVASTWTIYLTFRKIKNSNRFNFNIKRRVKKIKHLEILEGIIALKFLNTRQIRFLKLSLGIVIVSVVAYFYLFTVLVWDELSIEEIHLQTKEFSNVPWYYLPIKFGLTGLLGLAFILSYLFKKFEKEIFIFGIIAIIAFFAGPYYDEHRFGKYIMTSMAAFAALLIYKIISSGIMRLKLGLRPLLIGISLGIVVTSCCLSIFMFAGYVKLFTGVNDLIEGGRRDFPTTSEIQLLNFLNNKIILSKSYNIALPEKEATSGLGFNTKIYGFSPIPRDKLLQSPLTLNASSLEGLYNLLNYTDARFIIIPHKDVNIDTEKESISSSSNNNVKANSVLRFVLDNFPRTYEDENYTVLQVLPLTPASPKDSNVALVYQRDFTEILSPVTNKSVILPIASGSFGFQTPESGTKNNSDYNNSVVTKKIDGENKTLSSSPYTLTLGGNYSNNNSKSISLWSHPVNESERFNYVKSNKINHTNINYIEGNFRIIDDLPALNKSEKKNADKFGAGIVWEHGNNTYLASISDVGLQLSQSPSKVTLLTKQPANATGTAIDEAIKIITTAANATTKSTGEVMTKANSVLNLAASAGANATQTAMDEAKNNLTNVTNNVSNIASNTTGTAMAEARKLISAASKASNNATNATGTTMTQPESVVSIPSKITSPTKQPEQVNNTNNLKQVLPKLILSQNEEIKRQKGIWNNLKIFLLKNNIEIYVNDILRMKVPIRDYNPQPNSTEKNFTDDSISRVGISTYYSKSEFEPLILGQISNSEEQSNQSYKKIYLEHYYPLTILALSKVKYDTFIDDDLSAFSKKYVIVPSDIPSIQENEVMKYLEYVNKGGTLIVLNSDNNFEGIFSKLLGIKLGNLTKFNAIETSHPGEIGGKKYSLNVSGMARNIEFDSSSNSSVQSYYVNSDKGYNNQQVAPFVIEKNYGNGRILYVNAIGYFDSIIGTLGTHLSNDYRGENEYLATLSKVAQLIGIRETNQYVENKSRPSTLYPTSRIVGDLQIFPNQIITVNSSSLLLPDSNSSNSKPASYNLSAGAVSVSTSPLQKLSLTKHRLINDTIISDVTDDSKEKKTRGKSNNTHYDFKRILIRDLKLYGGPFEIILNVTNSTRPIYLPTSSSHNDYISMSIPKGFDMTVKFPDNNSTSAQFDIIKKKADKNSFQRIKISGYNNYYSNSSNNTGQILFHDVGTDPKEIRYITALMKSPEIKILKVNKVPDTKQGPSEESIALRFKKNSPDSDPIDIQKARGNIKINVDHVDNYNEPYHNRTKTQFITYLKDDIQVTDDKGKVIRPYEEDSLLTKLISKRPGDISAYAKEHGIEIPWPKVISSKLSIIIALIVSAITVIVITLRWYKIKFNIVKR